MSEILSKGAYAIRLGKMPSAVSNWIARGKLTGAALTADGRIVVEEADRQLGLSVDPGRGRPSISDLVSPPALRAIDRDEPQSLAQVRLQRETLALEAQQRAAATERGELMRVDEASRAWAAELEDLLLATEQFVVDLPAKLGEPTREAVDVARREWREFRRRRAEQMSAPAAVGDPRQGNGHAA